MPPLDSTGTSLATLVTPDKPDQLPLLATEPPPASTGQPTTQQPFDVARLPVLDTEPPAGQATQQPLDVSRLPLMETEPTAPASASPDPYGVAPPSLTTAGAPAASPLGIAAVAPPPDPTVAQPDELTPATNLDASGLWSGIKGFFSGGAQGVGDVASEGQRLRDVTLGQGFTDPATPAPAPPTDIPGQVGYGVAHGAPTLAAAGLGAVAGTAVGGPVGGVVGGAAGMGLGSFAQALIPNYDRARAQGLDHDAAVDYALKSGALEGGFGAASYPLFAAVNALPFLKSALSKIIANTVITAPAVGTAQRVTTPAVMGGPMPSAEDLGKGALVDAVTGAVITGTHLGTERMFKPPEFPTITPTGTPEEGAPGPSPPGAIAGPQQGLPAPPAPSEAAPPQEAPGAAPAPPAGISEAQPPAPQEAPPVPSPAPAGGPAAVPPAGGPSTPPGQPDSDAGGAAPAPAPVPGAGPQPTGETVPEPSSSPPAPTPTGVTPNGPVPQPSGVAEPGSGTAGGVVPPGSQVPPGSPPPTEGGTGDRPDTGGPPAETPGTSGAPPVEPTGNVPAAEGGPGTERTFTLSDGQRVPSRYEVVEADTLKPATGDEQPRDRESRIASDKQIAENASRLDYGQVGPAPTLDMGAPVVTPDHTILAGNGRYATINRAAELHPDKYQAYRDELTKAGYDVSNMTRPVLIRRTGELTPETRQQIADESNVSRPMRLSATEQAKVDARNLTPDILNRYQHGAANGLTANANQPFIRAWVNTLPKTEHNAVLDAHGQLSAEGVRRIQGAMIQRAYGSDDILKRALESTDDDTRSITGALVNAAPAWAKLRNSIDAGSVPKAFDITPNINRALDMVRQARERGMTPKDMLAQDDAFNPVDDTTKELFKSFYNDNMTRLASKVRMTQVLRDYTSAAHDFKSGTDLLGHEAKPDPAALLRKARSPQQSDLLSKAGEANLPTSQEELVSRNIEARRARGQDTSRQEAQLQKLQAARARKVRQAQPETRSNLDTEPTESETEWPDKLSPEQLAARNRFRPRRGKTPYTPPELPGRPRTSFKDYLFNTGEPVWKTAFMEAGHNPDNAVNYPIARQIKILTTQTKAKFGFANVEVAPGMEPLEARDALLDTYRAGNDMMASLALPVDQLSLGGLVSLRLEPLGGKYLGLYDLRTRTIHLAGRANTLGHEWTHALDHAFVDLLANAGNRIDLLSKRTRAGLTPPSDSVLQAFADVINALFYDEGDLAATRLKLTSDASETDAQGNLTGKAKRATTRLLELNKGAASKLPIKSSKYRAMSARFGDPKYWANAWELLSRAHEAYIARVMENNGADPRGAVMPDEAYINETDRRLRDTYPKEDRLDIFEKFDAFHHALRMAGVFGSPAATMTHPGGLSDPAGYSRLAKNTPRGPSLVRPFRDTVNKVRDYRNTLKSTRLFNPERPEGRGMLHDWANVGRGVTYSKMGILEAIHHQAPDAAKPSVQRILDKVGLTPGSGRNVRETFEERSRNITRTTLRRFGNIMDNNDLGPNDITLEQKDLLHHALTTGDTHAPDGTRIPDNVTHAAGQIRELMNDHFRMNQKAGLDIKYAVSAHFPRVYDHYRIYSDPQGFIRDATKLHKFMFDEDVGTPGDDPQKLHERWRALSRVDKDLADNNLRDGMRKLGANLRRQKQLADQIAANPPNKSILEAELDAVKDQARILAEQQHDPLGFHIAGIAADNWQTRVNIGYSDDFDTVGPSGNYLNHRVLPPEADQIMKNWMITDANTALPRYFMASARRVAHAEQFGPKGDELERLLAEASRAGLNGEDAHQIRKLVQLITGKTDNTDNAGFNRIANVIHAGVTLGVMPRAIFSMMTEPFVAALHTRDIRAGFKALAYQFGQVMHTADSYERSEVADFIGVTTSAIHDDILLSRSGSNYAGTPDVGKFMGNFYRTIGMTQWNNSTRRATSAALNWYLKKLSRDLLSTETGASADKRRQRAVRAFNEYGVPSGQGGHDKFANWMLTHDGMPSMDTLMNDPMSAVYSLALRRAVDRSVMDPYKADRPIGAEDPWKGMVYQFMSFGYTFQRNVLNPIMEELGHTGRTARDRAANAGWGKFGQQFARGSAMATAALSAAMLLGTYVLMNMLTMGLNRYLFSNEQWQKHADAGTLMEYLSGLGMQSIGGVFTPLTQIFSSLKYEQDISSIVAGAGPTWYARQGYDLIKPLVLDKTPNTNTVYHNQARAFYNLMLTPLEAYAAINLGGFGAPGRVLAAAALMKLTSPGMADTFADTITGYKGVKLPNDPEEADATGTGASDGTETADKSLATATTPWGLVDDVAVPAGKLAAKAWKYLPPPVKTAASVVLPVYGAYTYYNHMAKFRALPKPEPKGAGGGDEGDDGAE